MIRYEDYEFSSIFLAYKEACMWINWRTAYHVKITKEHDKPYKGFYHELCPSVYFLNHGYFIKIEDKYDPKKYEFRQINPRTGRYVVKKEKGSMPFGL